MRPEERRNRLRAEVVRGSATRLKGEENPVLIVPRIFFAGLKPAICPPGLLDVRPTLLEDAQLNYELLGQLVGSNVELPSDLIDDLRGPGTWIAVQKSHCCQLQDWSHSVLILDDIVAVRHKAAVDCFPGLLPCGWVPKD